MLSCVWVCFFSQASEQLEPDFFTVLPERKKRASFQHTKQWRHIYDVTSKGLLWMEMQVFSRDGLLLIPARPQRERRKSVRVCMCVCVCMYECVWERCNDTTTMGLFVTILKRKVELYFSQYFYHRYWACLKSTNSQQRLWFVDIQCIHLPINKFLNLSTVFVSLPGTGLKIDLL